MTVNEFVDKSFEPFQLHIKELEKQIKELEQSLDNLTVAYETLKLHDEEEISLLQAQIEKMKKYIKACWVEENLNDYSSYITNTTDEFRDLVKELNDEVRNRR